ncbi:MAG TPA: DUF3168 domain-containing protein [Noviherbaspirillum sp.]|jgi:hypothetical protein|uniref:DUF3168 domain-containing protein n=1 Tax=Noviherbaspirillum sp. TaxID=1926288 RepID=UPI002DDD16BE|nr:DUF3168 domain-containing protein [Noviherbaspirillum sp.]HEV2612540.1 DUF3168 domain-containing protein [Noviherbaspirillum sp.]
MTVESDIFNLLKGLAGNRVYPDRAPADTARPYIVYQQAGGESIAYVENTLPDQENARFQIAVWADTRMAAKALIKQVEAALVTTTMFQTKALGASVSTMDEELYGSRQDFSIWSSR